ncbi:hypothetical protein [Sphingomonas sp. PB4P5]|uniref:hypothetical protein n=1 Tax=Parasphingomonas puruogangriensis TaxID=3096155 RepID=UPI002FC64B3A
MAIALDRVAGVASTGLDAAQAILNALRSGAMAARGRQVLDAEPASSTRQPLVDLVSYAPEQTYGDVVAIPKSFWSGTDIELWDGPCAIFFDEKVVFTDVSLRERDVNLLIKLRLPQPHAEKQQTRERRRQARWDQWIAAVACLAREHQIEATMSRTALLDRVNARLERWNLDEMPPATVGPAARAILDRFRSDPPTDPLNPNWSAERKP